MLKTSLGILSAFHISCGAGRGGGERGDKLIQIKIITKPGLKVETLLCPAFLTVSANTAHQALESHSPISSPNNILVIAVIIVLSPVLSANCMQ